LAGPVATLDDLGPLLDDPLHPGKHEPQQHIAEAPEGDHADDDLLPQRDALTCRHHTRAGPGPLLVGTNGPGYEIVREWLPTRSVAFTGRLAAAMRRIAFSDTERLAHQNAAIGVR
jgi:hypothetical protein